MNDSSPSSFAPENPIQGLPVTAHSSPLPGSPEHTAIFLQDLVLDGQDVEHFLHNLARVAAEHMSRPDHEVFCVVTLLRPRQAETLASSSPAALKLDEIQYAYGDGPCLTAARTHELVHVRDTQTDDRWPQYFTAIADQGMRSIIGVPIPLEGEADCALNLYATTIDGFPPEAIEAAAALAREASRSLRLAVRIAQLSDKAENLSAALESRTIIDLAAGIVMGQNKCSQSEAIAILKTASSHRQMKLRALAAEMVANVTDEVPDTHFD